MNISKQRYVAYFRVSTQKQGRSGLGLDAQKQAVTDYLQQFGGELVAEFMEVESGKRPDRPEFKQWWLNPNQEEGLAYFNKSHSVVNAISDKLNTVLDFEADPFSFRKMSASELLKEIGIDKPTNGQSRECGAYLRDLYGEPRKVKGYMTLFPINCHLHTVFKTIISKCSIFKLISTLDQRKNTVFKGAM